jgi:ATP/maltotriose-dependent transcriptional regulator MalT
MTAEVHARTVEEMRYVGRPMAYLQSAFVYALICQARGLPDQARQKIDLALDFLGEIRSQAFVPLAQAFGAELALMQGDLGAASEWAATLAPRMPFTAMAYFHAPQLTLPKILLAQGTSESRSQAAEELSRLHAFVTSIHNTRFTIEVLALEALLFHAQANLPGALAALQQAVNLAQPGGLLRVFVDLGPALANLLRRLTPRGAARQYVDQILHAFPAERLSPQPESAKPLSAQVEIIEPLSRREMQVLELAAQHLTTKEIAEKLVLSDQTVKHHLGTIYEKLDVHGRRQAVAAAVAYGLLPPASRSVPLQ